MDLVYKLIDLLSTPMGLALLLGGITLALSAKPSRPRLRWLMFSACGFAASLASYESKWVEEAPALAFPLEQLRAMGRPLTLMLLGLILFNIIVTPKPNWRCRLFPTPIMFLVVVQVVIVLKILAGGSPSFAVLTTITYAAVVAMIVLGPSRWLQDEQNLILAMESIAMVGGIFAVANLYQATIDIYPIMFVNGWFLGTTGNPHHAAVLIVTVMPCLLFFCHHKGQRLWQQGLWFTGLGLAVTGLAATASRTGMAMATAAILAFYWRQGNRLVRLGLVVAAALLIGLSVNAVSGLEINLAGIFDEAISKVQQGEDTRSEVFRSFWWSFLDHPLVGEPLTADRLRFGESSWLGVAGRLGLAGLIPMALFGYTTIRMMLRLNTMTETHPTSTLPCRTVTAGLAALLVGGITEAYLLGNLSFAILALFLYLSMGNFLVEVAAACSSDADRVITYQPSPTGMTLLDQP